MSNPDEITPNPDEITPNPDEHGQRASPTNKSPSGSNSGDKQQPSNGRRNNPTAEVDSAPMVPLKPSPDRAVVSIMENPSVLDALVHEAPAEVLEFVEASDDRQFRYYMQREENRHKERLAREATTRIAIAAVGGAVLAAFGYSALTGDAALSTEIIAVIVGGFGGLGLGKLLRPQEEE